MALEHLLLRKPLYYDRIDLSRMPHAYRRVAPFLRPNRRIHIVGTNGKGSTGRMVAWLLKKAGYRVGHYTSPHLDTFHERIWIDGAPIAPAALERAHRRLNRWLGVKMSEALSYFEYMTLLGLVAFEACDWVVLEAGLGGALDATNVAHKTLSIITPIGMDHQAFLGDRIEMIAQTKLQSVMRVGLLARQPFEAVYRVADQMAQERGVRFVRVESLRTKEVDLAIDQLSKERRWPPFLQENAQTAAAAFRLLFHRTPPMEGLAAFDLAGRLHDTESQIIVDVGHNPLAAQAVVDALRGQRRILIYNALEDKEIEKVLAILHPIVEEMQIIPIESERAAAPERLYRAAAILGMKVAPFQRSLKRARYLVFGSFYTVEAFMRQTGWKG